jgi:ribosomal protein S18 acetylase RimI-like enzyme
MLDLDYTVRPVRKEDWEAFHQFDEEIFPEDAMRYNRFESRVGLGGFLIVESSDGKIIGHLALGKIGENDAHLGRVGVAKSMQNRGLGTKLMEAALDWFKKEGIYRAILYTQDYNTVAQHLYKKFGFSFAGTTWHYFVPYSTINPTGSYSCERIQDDEIDLVGNQYDESFPASQIRRFIESDEDLVLVLKDENGQLQGACRFSPWFPGCFPFEIEDPECLDDFVFGIQKFSLPEYDYVRLTFTDNPELATLCDSRGYKLHHRLYKMTLSLEKSNNQG